MGMFEPKPSSPLLRWFRRNMGFVGGTGTDGDNAAGGGGGGAKGVVVPLLADEETPLLWDKKNGADRDGAGAAGMLPTHDAAVKETIVAATAFLCFVASFASVLLDLATSNRSVLLSGILGCLLSPYAVMQQKKLTQIEALEQSNEQMEGEIAELSKENARLEASVRQLEESVRDLPEMEEALGVLQTVHGGRTLAQLREDLEDHHARYASPNRELDLHGTRIRGEAIRLLVKAMDGGGGGGGDPRGAAAATTTVLLSDAEIDSLVSDLDAVSGLLVDSIRFRDCVVEHGRAVLGLVHIVRHLLRTTTSPPTDEPQMFRFTPAGDTRTRGS